ncbi:PilW family protein [Shewanella abyssi]|uniref:PilW family protein n=1 Tax=Shewanella abyssi TaxID=311789 RepID=UPI00200C1484|nr:PilW family protein [Shewanella abyssi]MCL1051237.1 PilW family protein [Shewanella abyssi]
MSNRTQIGFSLVELMVAMVISLFLSAGLFSMFAMSSANVTTTSQFNQLQENGRVALALIERDVSQSGFMAELTGTDLTVGKNTTISAPSIPAASDCIGGGINNASFPAPNSPANFRKIWGYESGNSTESFACLSSVLSGTDVLQLKRLIGPNVTTFNSNSYYMATNPSEAIIFAGSQGAPSINNGRFWEFQHHIYFIKIDNGVPVLMRRVLGVGGMKTGASYEQLVEGVENFRVMYGFDINGDDSADSFMPAENVTSTMWDGSPNQRLVAMRIYILVRTNEEDNSYSNDNDYQLGDKTIAATNDGFRRRVLSSTIVLENPILVGN